MIVSELDVNPQAERLTAHEDCPSQPGMRLCTYAPHLGHSHKNQYESSVSGRPSFGTNKNNDMIQGRVAGLQSARKTKLKSRITRGCKWMQLSLINSN